MAQAKDVYKRQAKEGTNLVMNLGFSHQVIVPEIPGITVEVPGPNKIIIHGCDKQDRKSVV